MLQPLALFPDEPPIRWDAGQLNNLLVWSTQQDVSDVQLCSGHPVWMRRHGVWQKATTRALTTDELLAALERMTFNNSIAAFIKSGQNAYDFAHQIEESRGLRRRYRGNASAIADGYATGVKVVFRAIPDIPPTLSSLEVEPALLANAFPDNGLVLVTGVMGSGKSTLLAAMLRQIIEYGGRNVSTGAFSVCFFQKQTTRCLRFAGKARFSRLLTARVAALAAT